MRFFLISRCTCRAHAAFYIIEKLELSFQSIMSKLDLPSANKVQARHIDDRAREPNMVDILSYDDLLNRLSGIIE
jgi:hypothetical protein